MEYIGTAVAIGGFLLTAIGMICTAVWVIGKINGTATLLTTVLTKLEKWVGDIDGKVDNHAEKITTHTGQIKGLQDSIKRIDRRRNGSNS